MSIIQPADLLKILKNAKLSRALQLNKDKRVYNLKTIDRGFACCVLAESPLPFSVSLQDDGANVHTQCDCPDGAPCSHFWALAVRLFQDDLLGNSEFRAAIGTELTARTAAKTSLKTPAKPRQTVEIDLFGQETGQQTLFEDLLPASDRRTSGPVAGTDHERKHSRQIVDHSRDFDLFAELSLPKKGGIPDKSFNPSPPRSPSVLTHPRRLNTLFLVRFQTINRPDLWVETASLHGQLAADPLAHSQVASDARFNLDTWIEGSPEKQLSLGSALEELIKIQDGLQDSPVSAPALVCLATPGRRLEFKEIIFTDIKPVFRGNDPAQAAHYQLQLGFLVQGSDLSIVAPPSAVATEGGLSYLCPRDADSLLYRRNDTALAGLLTRIRNLPATLTALQIEQLRQWMAQREIPNARLEAFADEQFVYRDCAPRAILTMQGGIKRTELFLVFSYDGIECAYHDDAENLSRQVRDKTTLVIKRRRDLELTFLETLRQITAEMSQFESGLYANLVAKRTVPDISVVCELAEFVTRFGAALIAADIELRMEGRTIRSGGNLSFRAESDLDWFGFRAGWKPDHATADPVRTLDNQLEKPQASRYALVVDDHLDHFGMAGTSEPDGSPSWIMLGKRDIDRLKLLRKLGMDTSGVIETSPVNVTLIDSLYDQTENQDESHILRARELVRTLGEFTSRHLEASHFDDNAAPGALPEGLLPQPAGLKATLRNYQLLGFNWLTYLHSQNLGGCLADDMGLGKTVQTIALLQSLKEQGQLGPSLLIAPVVTLPNWEDELLRFAPTLSIHRHAGPGRAAAVSELLNTGNPTGPDTPLDIVIVSYHTLRNDLDLFVQAQWDYIILDEAHYIKNAGSQIFKAIRVLPSRHRLSLTGTPIENSTMELWSQFSFLNPGLLGSKKKFLSDVAMPIERDGSEEALGTLRDTIGPFILRRRKEDVLADLPPKDEILHWCEMGSDQAQLYEEHRAMYHDQIAGILNDQGVEKSSMDIFRCLLRLRQLAINPAMISRKPYDHFDDAEQTSGSPYSHISSAKMESLQMILDESMQEDHKTLVFSQFVSALKLISRALDKTGTRHALLTGATVDRRSQVQAFQNDPDLRLFLLSLKAGGVGINLTSADYVVLFDPWWNPAAERQAVDRAHRIGQKRPVLVYKFITRNTIEEKILALQAKKHRLAGNLIDGGDAGFFHGMSEDEVMDLFGK